MKSLAGKEQDMDKLQERIYAGKKTFAFIPLLTRSFFFV